MDAAINDRAPILVTRQGKGNVVLISEEEFASMEETLHLLRNPANAQRLLRSIDSAQTGLVTERELKTVKGVVPE
jgi:antitoxin YefM